MICLLEPLSLLSQLTKAQLDLVIGPFRQALIITLDLFASRWSSCVQATKAGNKLLKVIDRAFRKQPMLKPLFAEYA